MACDTVGCLDVVEVVGLVPDGSQPFTVSDAAVYKIMESVLHALPGYEAVREPAHHFLVILDEF